MTPRETEEMIANYPYFKKFVMDRLKEEAFQTTKPVTGGDLSVTIREEGGQPLEPFLREIGMEPEE